MDKSAAVKMEVKKERLAGQEENKFPKK